MEALIKKIPKESGFVTTTALTAVKNTIPNVNDIYEKIKPKVYIYITLIDYNKFTKDILDAKIKKEKLFNKSALNKKVKTLATKQEIKAFATKAELKPKQNKIVKLETFDLSYFLGKNFLVMMVFKLCLFINQQLIHWSQRKTRALIIFRVGNQRGIYF